MISLSESVRAHSLVDVDVADPTKEVGASPPNDFDPEVEVRAIRAARLRHERRERVIRQVLKFAAIAAFFLLWHWYGSRTSSLVLPTPGTVFSTMIDRWQFIVGEAWITLQSGFFGAVLGGTIGLGFGILIAHSARAEAVFNPFIIASQATPKVALAPLFVIWLGFGMEPKIAIAALISFFPLLENTVVGLRTVDPAFIKLFRSAGASKLQTFWRLRIVSAAPFIFAGARVSLLYALLGAIVGEFIAGSRGLGAAIVGAQGRFETPLMFALILSLTILGLLLYGATRLGERIVLTRLRLQTTAISDQLNG